MSSDSDLEEISIIKSATKNKKFVLSSASEVDENPGRINTCIADKNTTSETIATTSNPKRRKKVPLKLANDSDSDSEDNRPLKPPTTKRKRFEEVTGDGSTSSDNEVLAKKLVSLRRSSRTKIAKEKTLSISSHASQSEQGSDSDSNSSGGWISDDKENIPKKGRRNIRMVLSNKYLDENTIQASVDEKERNRRIEERQKLFKKLYDKPEKKDVLEKLVLDIDKDTQEILLEVDRGLARKLKPHQAAGVQFMWNACFESLQKIEADSKGSGCILSHCMGLGKTFTTVTLVHTLLLNKEKTRVKRVLVVAPKNTIANWHSEFKQWLVYAENGHDCVKIYDIYKVEGLLERAYELDNWHENGGVMLMSYNMFRLFTFEALHKVAGSQDIKDYIKKTILDPGPDLVVCDEGHLLKNEQTATSIAMNRIKTLRRISLTGTPLQNNLKEYYVMINFVKPHLLGTREEYSNRFANPICNGQYKDSSLYDIRIMKRRSHVLHKMLEGCVHRQDYDVLAPLLPPKNEYILSIQLTDLQVKLYEHYIESRGYIFGVDKSEQRSSLFADFNNLQRIWTHPLVLRFSSDRYEDKQRALERKARSIAKNAKKSATAAFDETEDEFSEEDEAYSQVERTPAKNQQSPEPTPGSSRKSYNPTEWWMSMVPADALSNIEYSGKFVMLLSILEECDRIGDKLLVFSQSLYSLDAIEHFLRRIDEQNRGSSSNEQKYKGSWKLGLDYFRLDGSTPSEHRLAACVEFNRPENYRTRLFLISTRAGGLGINLIGANRVVIFDVSWNPSNDIQSIFRVYRFGQLKTCYIYRFSALGTMEDKIYERQVTKQAISKRVIDEHQIDRHYLVCDLEDLYATNLRPHEPRQIPILPKDRLLAELLRKYPSVYKYHEHDSLLQNRQDEILDENERQAAWIEYENELKNRNRRPADIMNHMGMAMGDMEPAPSTSKKGGKKTANGRRKSKKALAAAATEAFFEQMWKQRQVAEQEKMKKEKSENGVAWYTSINIDSDVEDSNVEDSNSEDSKDSDVQSIGPYNDLEINLDSD